MSEVKYSGDWLRKITSPKMPYENSLSSGRKILAEVVEKDRIITAFPQAYVADATPHKQINFHQKVRDASSQNKTGTVGLKICKAVVVGDVAVGKTSLVNRFCHDTFDRDYKATIGVDFEVEKFSVLSVPFNLQVWDTAGQERFKCIAASYYRGANVVIVVFDLTDIETLTHCQKWKNDACDSASDPYIFLVGTKKDIVSDSSYLAIEEEAVSLANELGAEFWAVSSKTGENVADFFLRAVSLTYNGLVLKELEAVAEKTQQIGSQLIKVQKENQDYYEKKKKSCC